MDINLLLYGPGVLLLLASAVSLLFKNEGVRGAGRILGGIGTLLVGIFLLRDSTHGGIYTVLNWGVVLAAVVTIGSGTRKYLRRNAPQS